MHELTLASSILGIVQKAFNKNAKGRIVKIYIEVGELLSVDAWALQFGFATLAKDSIAHEASLEIISIPAKAICDSCKKTVNIKQYYGTCKICNSFLLQVIQGEELRVKSIEIQE